MSEVKAVLFDYGNVLSHPGEPWRIVESPHLKDLETDSFCNAYWHAREDYDRGVTEAAHYWSLVGKKLGRTFSTQEVLHLIEQDISVWSCMNEPMLDWVSLLKKSGKIIGLISNMPLELTRSIRQAKFVSDFDHCTFSCEIGLVKPHAKVYEHSLCALGISASDAVFIDDRKENIDAAVELGMRGHLFTNYDNLMQYALESGLLTDKAN